MWILDRAGSAGTQDLGLAGIVADSVENSDMTPSCFATNSLAILNATEGLAERDSRVLSAQDRLWTRRLSSISVSTLSSERPLGRVRRDFGRKSGNTPLPGRLPLS